MPSWADHIRQGRLTSKRRQANEHQAQNMALIVQRTQLKGGNLESAAGAIATAIQESNLTNIRGGDRDSLGLYQQRPSMGWGTPAQIMDPVYAIDKFLSIYLPYRARGIGWLEASHKTQRSAFASAPAQWIGEATNAARYFMGAGADVSTSSLTSGSGGGVGTETRELPYEFSRGTADKREDSWTCIGRLADEVGWRRYIRNGELWYVSEKWLDSQRPIYRISEVSRGVVSLSYAFETRQEAAEATVQVIAGRYALNIGDVVELYDEGPADGKWIVATTRRDLTSSVLELTLKRAGVSLPEPAPQTQTVNVGGDASNIANTSSDAASAGGSIPARAYAAASEISSWNLPYRLTQRTLVPRPPSSDCSSGVSWVLLKAGCALPGGVSWGKWAPVSGNFTSWGQPGMGKFFTVWTNSGHIWIQWNGIGPMWRFDTGGGSGGRNWPTARSTGGFVARHWPGC
jgi:hypothetical protein